MNQPNAATGLTRSGRTVLALICAAVVAFYFWRCEGTVSELGRDRGADQYYNLLVAGFDSGQLSLKVEVPEGLKQLPDPYDPKANAPYRKLEFDPLRLHDASYYHGRIHLYFGVTPAVLLFWPFHAATGHWLTHASAVAIFCSLGFLGAVWLFRDVARRCFPGATATMLTAGTIAIGLANSVPLMLWRADVWEVPIACAYLLIIAALVAMWRAMTGRRAVVWMGAAGLAYGLAVGARPSALLGAVILLVPAIAAWRSTEADSKRRAVRLAGAAIAPMIVIGAGLALYNQLRFGNPLEFGQTYQLAGDRQDSTRHFSAAYVAYNFRLYFLSLAHWSGHFPFLRDVVVPPMPPGHGDVDMPSGILTNMPFTWFALAAFVGWRRHAIGRELRWLLGALVALAVINAVFLCFFYGTCTRYQVEFHPPLVLLAAVGLLALHQRGRRLNRLAMAAGIGCLAYSAAFGVLKSFQGTGAQLTARGLALARAGDEPGALRLFEDAVRASPERLDPRFYAGTLAERLGRIPEAIAQLEELVRLAPHHAIARNNLSQLLRRTGRIPEAIAQLEAAVQVRPDFFEAYFNLGSTLQEVGRHSEAAESFRRAAALRPEFAEAHYERAVSLRAIGRMDEARAEYTEARRLKPTLPELAF